MSTPIATFAGIGANFDAETLITNMVTAEKTDVSNVSTVLPVDPASGAISATPFTINDSNSLLGWNLGAYVQDEFRLTNQLTLNYGIRFDQLYQFVDSNQFSPRVNLVYTPLPGTTFHAGYARYFTPPPQTIAAPVNLALVANTTAQPSQFLENPVLPERAHVFVKQERREQREVELAGKIQALPDFKAGVIYGDPPWQFEVYSLDTGLDLIIA